MHNTKIKFLSVNPKGVNSLKDLQTDVKMMLISYWCLRLDRDIITVAAFWCKIPLIPYCSTYALHFYHFVSHYLRRTRINVWKYFTCYSLHVLVLVCFITLTRGCMFLPVTSFTFLSLILFSRYKCFFLKINSSSRTLGNVFCCYLVVIWLLLGYYLVVIWGLFGCYLVVI